MSHAALETGRATGRFGAAVLHGSADAADRARCERELAEAGLALPLSYCAAAASCPPWNDSWFVAIRDLDTQRCVAGFAVQVKRLALPPGHRVLRVVRFGATIPAAAVDAAAEALAALVQGDPRTLRLNVELFSADPAERAVLASALQRRGFEPSDDPSCYHETLVVDLTPDEDAILASFQRSARRNIREIAKHPIEIRPLDDPALGGRMNALLEETMARTGGKLLLQDWTPKMRLSTEHPELSRLVGVFRTDPAVAGTPESLLAFAWGCFHGDHGQYADAASTRETGSRVALAYPLLWDLMVWAKRSGARWFDLGGVTRGSRVDAATAEAPGAADPLAGISDFKRFFTSTLAEVGEEWVLEPDTIRARLARAVHRRLSGRASVPAAHVGDAATNTQPTGRD